MEFEIKLAVADEATMTQILQDPIICSRMTQPLREIPMETTYYDTETGSLSAKKWTLRRRMEDGVSVVTVKTPGDRPHAREEWEIQWDDVLSALPRLVDQGAPAPLLDIQAVQPICGAAFLRRAVLLSLDGCLAELALDTGKLYRGQREGRISELELELKQGDPSAMLALQKTLTGRYGLREEEKSKFYRASHL